MPARIDAVNEFFGKSRFPNGIASHETAQTMMTLFCGGEGTEGGESPAKRVF